MVSFPPVSPPRPYTPPSPYPHAPHFLLNSGVVPIPRGHNPSSFTMALDLTQPLTEMSTRNISRGIKLPVRRADNLTTFMCRLSWNLGVATFWNPQGLSRPEMGLLDPYLYLETSWFCPVHNFHFTLFHAAYFRQLIALHLVNKHLSFLTHKFCRSNHKMPPLDCPESFEPN